MLGSLPYRPLIQSLFQEGLERHFHLCPSPQGSSFLGQIEARKKSMEDLAIEEWDSCPATILITKWSHRLWAPSLSDWLGAEMKSYHLCFAYAFLFVVKDPVCSYTIAVTGNNDSSGYHLLSISMCPLMYCGQYRHHLTQEHEARPKPPALHHGIWDTMARLWCESTVGQKHNSVFKSVANSLRVITWKTWIKKGSNLLDGTP